MTGSDSGDTIVRYHYIFLTLLLSFQYQIREDGLSDASTDDYMGQKNDSPSHMLADNSGNSEFDGEVQNLLPSVNLPTDDPPMDDLPGASLTNS